MLKIQKFVCNMIQENCYVVSDETGEGIIIDCGAYYEEERQAIVDYVKQNNITLKHLVATHGHFDHNFGNKAIYDTFKLKPKVPAKDKELLENLPLQVRGILGMTYEEELPPVGRYLEEGDTISFGSHTFTIIATPGHTPGCSFYYCEQEHVAFSGDTLFKGAIGRTDLEGGSMFQIIQSLRTICQLPDNTRILPGHGAETTIGYELASNPYLDR